MAARSGPISNVLAGAFLLLGVVLAIVVSFVLSGAMEQMKSKSTFTVWFALEDGASGIKRGSDVLVGGQLVGKVSAVAFAPGREGRGDGINVRIGIPAELSLRQDARVFLERPLVGSLSSINIASLGTAGAPALKHDGSESVVGRLAPPSFLAQAGFGTDQINQVQSIIAQAERAVKNLDRLVDENSPKLNRAVEDAAGLVHDVRVKVPEWTGAVDRTVANVESASAKTGPLMDDARARVEEGRALLADAKAVVEDARPKISNLLTSSEQAADKINRESVDRLNASLVRAQEAIDAFAKVATESGSLIREQTPSVRKVLANARLASDQLKLALVELRSQPWRALYVPSLKETETSVLYDTARNYAAAVSDLRAASEALEAVVAAENAPGSAQAADRQDLQALTSHLKGAFEKYKAAESALLERLMQRAGTSAAPPPDSSRSSAPRAEDNK